VSIEIAGNFAQEWVPDLQWYWYVSRAVRNSVWVVFANTAANADSPGHGHSAVIAPDGRVIASVPDARETMLLATLDLAAADRQNMLRRSSHPALAPFWQRGARLVSSPPKTSDSDWKGRACPQRRIKIFVGTAMGDVHQVLQQIEQGAAAQADLIALPARAIAEQEVESIRASAATHEVTVVIGTEHRQGDRRYNSALVIGPTGQLITRYDQLSAMPPFAPGADARRAWFDVQGIPAVVTLEGDRHWTEIAELSAVAGARLLVHLEHSKPTEDEMAFQRFQSLAVMASYRTATVVADTAGAFVWEDLHSRAERRSVVRRTPGFVRPDVEVFSPFSANLLARGAPGRPIVVDVAVPGPNDYYMDSIQRFPGMAAWARYGASLLQPLQTRATRSKP